MNLKEEQKLKRLVKENFFTKLKQGAKSAVATTKSVKKQMPSVIKRETRETKIAMKILLRILKRKDVTKEEIAFLKQQSGDVAKVLGLLAGGIISIPLTVALTAFLEKKGVNVLPQESGIDLTEYNIKIMEQAINIVESEVRVPFQLEVSNDIRVLNQLFGKAGFDLFIVGGAIRDAKQGIKPKDYDLATDATPKQIIALLNQAQGYNVIEAGETFPVVHVNTPDHVQGTDVGKYEIATFRQDKAGVSGDHSKPETAYSTIDQDAIRRDLTINALYYDLDTNEIVDFVGGLNDLENGIVRMVGDPTQRFDEHRIRVLRAIRFAARMGKPLDQATADSIRNNNTLGGQPDEAIQAEFIKGIKQAKSVQNYLDLLQEFDLFPQILPNINVDIKQKLTNDKDFIVVMASILRNNDANKLMKDLKAAKYSNEYAKAISYLVDLKNLNERTAKSKKEKQFATALQIGKAGMLGIGDPKMITAFLEYTQTPRLTGDDAEVAGVKKNTPEMGKWLSQAEAEIFSSILNR